MRWSEQAPLSESEQAERDFEQLLDKQNGRDAMMLMAIATFGWMLNKAAKGERLERNAEIDLVHGLVIAVCYAADAETFEFIAKQMAKAPKELALADFAQDAHNGALLAHKLTLKFATQVRKLVGLLSERR